MIRALLLRAQVGGRFALEDGQAGAVGRELVQVKRARSFR